VEELLDVLEPVLAPGGVELGEVEDDADESVELLGGGVVRTVESLRVVESVRVLGDAEGATRSRSVTRSVLSVQPASTPAPSAITQNPVSNLLIVVPPWLIRPEWCAAMGVPPDRCMGYAGRPTRQAAAPPRRDERRGLGGPAARPPNQ
jgi:hypothetical protein